MPVGAPDPDELSAILSSLEATGGPQWLQKGNPGTEGSYAWAKIVRY